MEFDPSAASSVALHVEGRNFYPPMLADIAAATSSIHINHRKLVVVDGRIGWVGGAGIEDHFENGAFHDLFVRVEGPVVAQLQLVFVASLRWLGGAIPASAGAELFPPLDAGASPVTAVVLHNAPGRFR